MKTLALAGSVVVALSACGSMSAGMSSAKVHYEVDQEKMAQVERLASKNGVKVIWVSAPRRVAVVKGG
jgi:uncharacterized membrane protein